MMIGMRSFFLALALAAVLKTPAYAQNFSVSSVSTADFGNVAAASTGQTILRASPATGAVTAVSGAGARISSGMVRSLVTIACAGPPACNSNNAPSPPPAPRPIAPRSYSVSTSQSAARPALSQRRRPPGCRSAFSSVRSGAIHPRPSGLASTCQSTVTLRLAAPVCRKRSSRLQFRKPTAAAPAH